MNVPTTLWSGSHAAVLVGFLFSVWAPALSLFFFFFQAEDGIRDHCVTGVQTCALPISTGADPAARPPRSACPRCGGGRAAERWRRRTIETQLGGLTFTRTRYRCEVCQQRWSGADRTLGLRPRQRTSAGLARWEADVAARTTFREAAELLEELAGVQVGSETLRTHAERLGTEREGQQRRAMA